jgi:polyhydroxyalkanoate synthesis regulator phasin
MAEKPQSSSPFLPPSDDSSDPSNPQARRPSGHRADMRDTVAELAERAQAISQEAGTKVASAMKDVIGAAAGIAGFAIESARDLVQYMVRRGQMTPEEGDRLIREAEAAHDKRSPGEKGRPTASKGAADRAAVAKAEAAARAAAQVAAYARPVAKPAIAPQPSAAKAAAPTKGIAAKTVAPKASAPPKAKPAKPVKAAKPSKPAKKKK